MKRYLFVNQAESNKDYSSDSSSDPENEPNYRAQYLSLKKKLKYLIYVCFWTNCLLLPPTLLFTVSVNILQENECFQDALRSSQKRLLKVTRDRSFLLDRLLQYEKPDSSSSESEDTESSDDTSCTNTDGSKR